MPFKSKAQRAFMFAQHPEMAKEFEAATPVDAKLPEHIQKMADGGVVEDEDKDASIIPEDVKEFVKKAHQDQQEMRPDESWRITPPEKNEPIAPYKRDDEDLERDQEEMASPAPAAIPPGIPHFDEGGVTGIDPNVLLSQIAPQGTGALVPSPAPQAPPPQAPDQAPIVAPPPPAPMAAPKAPMPTAPVPTDADYMSRANKMLGLDANQSAAFLKMLGDRSQKAQLGAGVAGIGDAIASGGTLGKVNPGGLNKAEELITNKENEGIQGMQTIRGNQEKAQELGDKLQARDPKSPLSKYAQKAYAGVGKKIGLDLSNASASLIGDVTGKGVDALNTEYQNQLKLLGLTQQKEQIEATIGNQKSEREIAKQGHQLEAQKTLADMSTGKKIVNALTSSGRAATKGLEETASGRITVVSPDGRVGHIPESQLDAAMKKGYKPQ